jgi:predicted O-methyltransferase YrrM
MSNHTIKVDDALYDYILRVSVRELPLLRELREETAALPNSSMQISPEQGQLMYLLVKLIGARRCLEIGVFTGYSSLCVAMALPEDGQLIACDSSEEWTDIARRYWHRAGLQNKIELRLAPALRTLEQLLRDHEQAQYDFVFIDADKTNYLNYYEAAFKLLRPGGLIAVDNTLWGGSVTDSNDDSESTKAIRAFNEALYADPRVDLSLVPIGDGLTLARKRE